MLEAIRDDPSMADDVIGGADYVRVELFYAAQTEMITKLDDFLRRRSKIALVLSYDDIEGAKGIHEACRLLFGDDARKRYDEYFSPERRAEYEALRRSADPAPAEPATPAPPRVNSAQRVSKPRRTTDRTP